MKTSSQSSKQSPFGQRVFLKALKLVSNVLMDGSIEDNDVGVDHS